MIRTPFLIARQILEETMCGLATRGRHCPSWALAVTLGYRDRPVCRACRKVLPREPANPRWPRSDA